MSLEQALLTHAEALNNYAAALRETAGATPKVESKTAATAEAEKKTNAEVEKKVADDAAAEKKAAADKKAAAAAEKKAAADKKAAAAAEKKAAEITDEDITAVFGPLLAKTIDADQLASNKQFVATINEHFGVAKLRELDQEQRKVAIEWGKARAEDGEFEIPAGDAGDDEDDAI